MAKKPASKSVDELDYEAAFGELQEVVASLEAEPESLEEAMSLFERGQILVQRCMQLLEQAELKVKVLSSAGEPPPEE
jgi:exodeoxyribonuclease VII small subunit